MDDLISRRVAIDVFDGTKVDEENCTEYDIGYNDGIDFAVSKLSMLPSARPEIIRCKDCKYRDENWRRVSVRWLPCMDVRTGSNWYCGSAERGEQYDEQRSN